MKQLFTLALATLLLAAPGCSAAGDAEKASAPASAAQAADDAKPAAPANAMPENCGMGGAGSCCGACQAEKKAVDPAGSGGCPCQKARKNAQGS